MFFGNRDKNASQMKAVMEETATELHRRQTQELKQHWEKRECALDEAMEKNHRALRSLSDTMEDFLDSLQDEDGKNRYLEQELADAKKREQGLLSLIGLYREQMELFEQWFAGQETGADGDAREAWHQQYAMLKGKIVAEGRLCAVETTGVPGEPVDYRLHEILQAVEPETKEQEGTVARVCSQGLVYQGAVVKKARVFVYAKA